MNHIYQYIMKQVPGSTWLQRKWVVMLLLSTVVTMAMAQQRTVTGKVTDATDGLELPGVNVFVKGTTNGTATDFNGNYSITVDAGDVLVYSFVGYTVQEVAVGAQSIINLALELNLEQLQEVVVVGYGAVQKKDLTGVVAAVKSEDFNKGIITSPTELLTGKVAGVSITTSGGIGNAPQVRIRGISSLSASSDPLYVIDGVIIDNDGLPGQRNPMNFINPEDIETMVVLKDASAGAIYGSRAAAGVIIITTKKGTTGTPKITYDAYYSNSRMVNQVSNLNAAQFSKLISTQFTDLTPRLGQANTNWIDEVTQVGQGMKHSVSFTDNNFFMSVMNQKLNGVVRHDQLDIYNFSINYGKKFLKDVVELNISVKNGFTKNNFGDNQIGAATDFNPTQPVYDPASIFGGYFEPQNIGELGVQNPVARQDLVTNTGRSFRSLGKAELIINVPFVEGLSFTNNLSYDVSSSKNRYFQPKNLFGAYGRGFLNYDEGAKETYLYETFANYKKQLSSDQLVEITAGYSFQTFSTEGSYFAMDSLVSDLSTIYDPSVAKVIRPGAWYNIKYQQSYFGRVNYSLKDKYLVTANARYDGSSQFGPENRYGFFPSVALGWRLIDEDFMGFARNTFDELKIRASYGVLGNQNFAPYLYENFYYLGTIDARYQFGSDFVNTLRPTPVDKGIKWEVSNTLNIGLDYDLVGGRINGSLEYYERMTKDLLFDPIFPVGTAVGFRYISNIGVMKNKGVELQVSAVVVDKSDYSWNISFNAAHNSNEILRIDNSALGGVEAVPSGGISGDVGQTIQVIQVGYPINTFSVYEHKYEGGLPVKDRLTGSRTDMYVDQNNDDIINEDDRVPFESANPDFEFGLTSHARYKNFDLSFTLRSRIGNYVYNNVASSKGFKNRVKELGGPYNIHTSALVTNFSTKQLFSDYYVENASFVRMDNITLSYNIDALKFAKIRLYTTAQNLFTLTNYSGLDPEIGNGIDNSLYPRALQLVGGINVNF